MTAVRVAFTTVGSPRDARRIGRALVDERLAACVTCLPGASSIYRWKGRRRNDRETLLVIKTTARAIPRLERRLAALHPYDVPEFLVLPVASGSRVYLAWLRESVR